MKVLLTHAYFIKEDPREQKIMKPYPPLGILSISAFLSKSGIENEVFDTTFSSFEEQKKFIDEHRPKYIGVYTNLMSKLNVIRLINYVKSRPELQKTTIFVGGPDVTYNVENYLGIGADVVIIGEGEQTTFELISTMEVPFNPFLDHIDGIAYKNATGEITRTKERARIKEVDSLPWPARNKIDISKYLDTWKKYHGKSTLNLNTQRGCPYTCRWCSTAVYGQSYRRRSPEEVVKEMLHLQDTYSVESIWFVDDVFTVSHEWLKKFKEQVRLHDLNMPYECISRADRMNEEVIELLQESGCYRIWIGAESGSQEIIDAMDRRVEVGKVQEMIQKCNEAGIETGTFIMLGYPGEKKADIKATVQHLKKSNPTHFTITITYPIKGTSLYNQLENEFVKKLDWSTTTDRDIDFNRPYSRKFYDYAVRYVYNEVNYYKLVTSKKAFHRALYCKTKAFIAKVGMWFESNFRKSGNG